MQVYNEAFVFCFFSSLNVCVCVLGFFFLLRKLSQAFISSAAAFSHRKQEATLSEVKWSA